MSGRSSATSGVSSQPASNRGALAKHIRRSQCDMLVVASERAAAGACHLLLHERTERCQLGGASSVLIMPRDVWRWVEWVGGHS